jgi:hypothetical protein
LTLEPATSGLIGNLSEVIVQAASAVCKPDRISRCWVVQNVPGVDPQLDGLGFTELERFCDIGVE